MPLYDEVFDVNTFFRTICFGARGTGTNCIKTRLSQPVYRAVKNIKQRFLSVVNGLEYQNQL